MQRLVAPTRKEIDDAHSTRKWLDIGMPSVRNLASISKVRMVIWVLLGLSSIPLHFVYNSVVFETTAANKIKFVVVAPDFFTDKNSWHFALGETVYNSTWDNDYTKLQNTLLNDQYLDRTKFENITYNDCKARYAAPFITTGSGFGVPNASQLAEWNAYSQYSSLLDFYVEASGNLDIDLFHATTNGPGISYFGRMVSALVVTGALFAYLQFNYHGTARNGFGALNTSYLIDIRLPFAQSVIPYVLLANLPQAVCSFIYLTYNGMFTCMLANREWSHYGTKRATLRVTIPSPGQRSTHFLQLPYSFSIPLLIGGVLLHWFISQSIFLARIAVYKDGVLTEPKDLLGQYQHMGKSSNAAFTGIGYSDAGMIACLTWGGIIVVFLVVVSNVMTYPKGVPLGGTNSAVISAACHFRNQEDGNYRLAEENDIASQPLKWGVTMRGGRERVGHCCFSAGEVEEPIVGHLYAGEVSKAKST
ncbi:uncharacterized protein N0V89_002118 [Didymosphaeria variabile]|uniref:DUF6536 domain-containing protein n=1 Tax=Didymosphaeria variabile TaxID=1932322 RepID=A0A9W8XU70_9PLEO|nr:uncharacterized protein N0V89_002118 [Didymosphaeria variabile]KAJ4357542.1 hypothetical protein N0V89_002118 [Didymosphaeria variabile]